MKYIDNVNLIFAGRKNELTYYNKIVNNPLYGERIFFIEEPNDDEIIYLFQNSIASVFPNFNEGFGLPIVESLFNNCPVFTSNIPIFKEITNGKNITISNDAKKSAQIITSYINNPSKYKIIKKQILKNKYLTWEQSFEELIKIIER